jgi:hemoglobin
MNLFAPPRRALALLALAAAPVFAQTPPDTLFQDFGGQAGIAALMSDFVPRLKADPRTAHFFEKTDLPTLQKELALQFCEVSGGPCKRKGPDMKTAHQDFEIRRSDFNALVEVLQQSMDARGIAFGAQNRMLARLAPMHRDIVNTP